MKRIFILAILICQPLFSEHAWATHVPAEEAEKENAGLKKAASEELAVSILGGTGETIDPSAQLGPALLAAQTGDLSKIAEVLLGENKLALTSRSQELIFGELKKLVGENKISPVEVGLIGIASTQQAQVQPPANGNSSGVGRPQPAAKVESVAEKLVRAANTQVVAANTNLKAAELNAQTARTQGAAVRLQAETALAEARGAVQQAQQQQQQAQQQQQQAQQAQQQAQQQQALQNQAAMTGTGTSTEGGDKKDGDKEKLAAAKVAESKSAPNGTAILSLINGGAKKEGEEGGPSVTTFVAAAAPATQNFVGPVNDASIAKNAVGILKIQTSFVSRSGPAMNFANSVSGPEVQRAIAPERLLSSVGTYSKAAVAPSYGITIAGGSSNNARFLVSNQPAASSGSSYEKTYDADVRAAARARSGGRSAKVLESVSTPAGGHKGAR